MNLSVGKTKLGIKLSSKVGIVTEFMKKVVCVLLTLVLVHCQQERNVPCVGMHSHA